MPVGETTSIFQVCAENFESDFNSPEVAPCRLYISSY